MKPLDFTLYAWSSTFWLCLCIGFPPLALAYLLLPLWHHRRRAAAVRQLERRRLAARAAWVDGLR